MFYKKKFVEKTTSYLKELAKTSEAVNRIYFIDCLDETHPDTDIDLLLEKQFTKSKGIVFKYPKRALILLSYTCLAYCRYCERQDRVGVGYDKTGYLEKKEIFNAVECIKNNVEINEVIFSGGDPLTNIDGLNYAIELLKKIDHVKIIRIHSRMPLQLPSAVNIKILSEFVKNTKVIFYFSIHVVHPDELTYEAETVINKIRKLGYIMLSQSVFLRGINDNYDTLEKLFIRLSEIGVRPYYIYHCQALSTTKKFIIPLDEEIKLITRLRENVSGIAFPQFVLDLQGTIGKIIVPTNHWFVDTSKIKDFRNNIFDTNSKIM